MVIPNTCGLTLRFPTNSSQTFACSGKWLHRYELFALKCKTIEVTRPTISRLWQKYKRRYDLKFLTANSTWAQSVFSSMKHQTSALRKWREERTDLWRLCNGQKLHSCGQGIRIIWHEHHPITQHMQNSHGDAKKKEKYKHGKKM